MILLQLSEENTNCDGGHFVFLTCPLSLCVSDDVTNLLAVSPDQDHGNSGFLYSKEYILLLLAHRVFEGLCPPPPAPPQ